MGRIVKVICLALAAALVAAGSDCLAAELSKLAFVRGGSIWLANSDGTGLRQLTHATQDRQPTLSPGGRWVAFTSGMAGESGFGRIFLISSAGGQARLFQPPGLQGGEHPAFSPDGKGLLFVGLADFKKKKEQGGDQSFATMSVSVADLTGMAVRQIISNPNTLLDTGYIYSNPAFSADGRLVAYQESGSDVSGGFVVMDLEGKRLFRFPRDPQDSTPYWRPRFFPEGKKVLCYSPATSAEQVDTIYWVDLATGRKTKITEGGKPTLVDQARAIVFERWPQDRWQASGKVTADLWRLELAPGAQAQKIITDGQEPAGL
jgi:Tol biopolymer transport system component